MFLATIRSLLRLLKNNYKKKMSFLSWYQKRNEIRNWLYLYLYYTSLMVDCMVALFGNKKFIRKLKIKAYYSNGITLSFPMSNSRYHSMFFNLTPSEYLLEYEKCYSKKIDFIKEDLIIDIGAHIGRFSLPLFIAHPYIRVLAFEPDPYNFDCLRQNLEINTIDRSRFKIMPFAVYSRRKRLSFSIGRTSTRSFIANAGFLLGDRKCQQVYVDAITLEDIFNDNQINNCKLLKMDCEGSEFEIFKSISDSIISKIEKLFIEVHPVEGSHPSALIRFLENKGFAVKGYLSSNGCQHLFCDRI